MSTGRWTLGILGGSGLYDIEGLENRQWVSVDTPWGEPSDDILFADYGDVRLRFLPRHGRGHPLSPSTVPYRANIDALKRSGCTDVLSISAVGSLKEAYAPGHFVAVNQFIDRTRGRESSFFGPGCVVHVSLADPVCSRLSGMIADAAEEAGATVHRPMADRSMMTYLAMEGPQFSTKAESHLYRHWGADVIGMTNMPEAKLAREAELPYATLAMVTDYDCWHEGHGSVDVASVIAVLQQNAKTAGEAVRVLCESLQGMERTPSPDGIERCLDVAMITAPEARDKRVLAKLDAIAGRVL